MSAVPEQDGGLQPPWRLGQLLIERGLLDQQQLATALEQQQRTGSQLGEILVELGYVPAALIAQALATQHGGLLKTEYGFATGFAKGSDGASVAAPLTSAAAGPNPPEIVLRAPALAEPTRQPAAPLDAAEATEPAPAASAPAPAPEAEIETPEATRPADAEPAPDATGEELDALRARLAVLERDWQSARRHAAEATQRVQELERELELSKAEPEAERRSHEAAATPGEKPASVPDELWTRLEELDARLETAGEQVAVLTQARDELAEANARLSADLAEQTRRCDELEAELARVLETNVDAQAEPEPPVDRHLAFVGSPLGYTLVECVGPPPAVDTIVELAEPNALRGRHRVLRVGTANVPASDTPCAYLLPID